MPQYSVALGTFDGLIIKAKSTGEPAKVLDRAKSDRC